MLTETKVKPGIIILYLLDRLTFFSRFTKQQYYWSFQQIGVANHCCLRDCSCLCAGSPKNPEVPSAPKKKLTNRDLKKKSPFQKHEDKK